MKRTVMMLALAISAFTFVIFTSGTANALVANSNLSVGATMQGSCTVATTAINFGTYTSAQVTAITMNGSVDVTCTTGTSYTIDLGTGLNNLAGVRRMANGANFLNYELFWAPAANPAGTGTTGGTASTAIIGNGAVQNTIVYGNLPALQTGPSGAYSDTVLVTVNY